MKYVIPFLMLFLLILGTSCSSKSEEKSNGVSEQVQSSTSVTTDTAIQTSTSIQPYQSSSPSNTSTRSDAFQFAFNSGRQLGYSDGLKGVNDCYTVASAYSDEWIKQAFIQGYELGQAEAGSNSSDVEYEEVEYDDGEYYYDDEY